MDKEWIARLREATFPVGRRGYDREEVDRYLGELADWLEGQAEQTDQTAAVRAELDRVGRRTGDILTAAADAAEELRTEAETESRALLEETHKRTSADREAADTYASETRSEADTYAERTRAEVEAEADQKRGAAARALDEATAAAEARAAQIVEQAEARKVRIEAGIERLIERRDAVVESLEKLRGSLGSAVGEAAVPDAPVLEDEEEEAPLAEEDGHSPEQKLATAEHKLDTAEAEIAALSKGLDDRNDAAAVFADADAEGPNADGPEPVGEPTAAMSPDELPADPDAETELVAVEDEDEPGEGFAGDDEEEPHFTDEEPFEDEDVTRTMPARGRPMRDPDESDEYGPGVL
jgi:DivIVA domain-containing protein